MEIQLPTNPNEYLILGGIIILVIGFLHVVSLNSIDLIGGFSVIFAAILFWMGYSKMDYEHNLIVRRLELELDLLKRKLKEK